MKYEPAWDLSSIPDHVFKSEVGRRTAAMRKSPLGGLREGAGRKPELIPCPRGCGQLVTKTQARRGHGCHSGAD